MSTYLKIIEEKFEGREDFEKSFVVLKDKDEEIKMQKDKRLNKMVYDLQQKVDLLEE